MNTTAADPDRQKRIELCLTISVPVISFGGMLLGMLLESAGIIADAGEFTVGCILGSILLAYLAWIKPRRDIVSLLAPLYAFIIFIMPLELRPNLALQFLFAVSITILVVRLNKRFSTSPKKDEGEDPMEKFLYDYIHRISPYYVHINRTTAHEIASTVLSFKFGLFTKTTTSAGRALSSLPDSESQNVIKTALRIVSDRARYLEAARVDAYSESAFSPQDEKYVAVTLPPELIEDKDNLSLDNALILLYCVAYITSPDDGQILDEHQNFVLQILTTYKTALGL